MPFHAEPLRLLAAVGLSAIAEGMLLRVVLLVFTVAMLASCTSPLAGSLMESGKDAREFNPATGRYEWPDE